MIFSESLRLQKKGHALIPGAAHTYAKGDDQFPEEALCYGLRRRSFCHVRNVDGNEFIEYGIGLRAVTLRHAFDSLEPHSNKCDWARVPPLPSKPELAFAKELVGVLNNTDMVKFTKNGSDGTAVAVSWRMPTPIELC